jgi:hypothetical protein
MKGGKGTMVSVWEFLNAIAGDLTRRGTTSRDLVALQFELRNGNLKVLIGSKRHPENYPSLEEVFRMVSHTCEQDGIALRELEQITFFDTEINLECSGHDGEAVYTYPIHASTVH